MEALPYRAAVTGGEARAYLQAHAGTLFDPDVVSAFLCVLDEQAPIAYGD
jgi:response regulator RpfG family c-di-GMP phosphodiesterase